MKKISKIKFIFIVEIIYITALMIKCFEPCAEFVLDKNIFNNLNKSFEGELAYFEDGSVGIESQEAEEFEILNSTLNLGSGAYDIKIVYDSVSNCDNPSMDNSTGRVVFSADNSNLRASEIWLNDGKNETQSRIWIRQGGSTEVKVAVRYHGNGKLAIRSILVEEKREYRIIICIATILLFVMCDLLYFIFCAKGNKFTDEKTKFVIAGVIGITAFSSITYFADFLYNGHDLYFHLSRIVSLAKGIREFQIPHRMQFEMLNGYGYASPLYYGEVFLTLPAILYNFYVPIQTCYQVFVVLVNLATCVISYWCFSKISQDWRKGLLGSAIYTLSSYRMLNVMVRAAVGEYTALIFLPLLVYGFYNIYNKDENEKIYLKDYISIILSATGIINSHILSCEMVVIFLLFFMLLKYRKTLKKNIFLALVKCSIVTLLLNAWFIIPFLQSMSMGINVTNKNKINMIERSDVYLSQLFGIFHTAGGIDASWSTHNEMPLSLGLPVILGIAMFLYVCIKKEMWKIADHKSFKASFICFVLGLIALFFTSNLCKWDNIRLYSEAVARLVGMVQFPWRYLGIATVCFVFMIIFVLQIMEEHSIKRYQEIVMLLVAAVIITEGHFMMEFVNTQDEIRIYSESDIGTMRVAFAEYLLQDTNLEKYKSRDVSSEEGIEVQEFYYDNNGEYYLSCINKNDYVSYIDVPVQAYDNYHAYSSSGEELTVLNGENNRIRINIPERFDDVICLKYQVPVLWRMCEAISFITLCIIAFLMLKVLPKRLIKAKCFAG